MDNESYPVSAPERERSSLVTRFSVDHIPDPVFWINRHGRLLYVNDAFCRSSGYSRAELLSMTIHDIDLNYPATAWPSHWAELKRQGTLSFESVHTRKDGSCFPVAITINYLEYGGDEYNCAHARDLPSRNAWRPNFVTRAMSSNYECRNEPRNCRRLTIDY